MIAWPEVPLPSNADLNAMAASTFGPADCHAEQLKSRRKRKIRSWQATENAKQKARAYFVRLTLSGLALDGGSVAPTRLDRPSGFPSIARLAR